MANTIQIKRKLTTGPPALGSLADGEMCLVVPDSNLYQRVNSSTLILINRGGDLTSIETRLAALENSEIDPIGSLVWEEDFENLVNGITVFTNLVNTGTRSFEVNEGGTPSGGTGCSNAFSGVKYIYTETSNGVSITDTFELETTVVDASDTLFKLNYAYHAFFDASNQTAILIQGWDGVTWNTIKSYNNQQQTSNNAPFLTDTVDSNGFINQDFKFRIKMVMAFGTIFRNDFCLDKIRLYST